MIFRKKLKRGQLELASLVHSLLEKTFFFSFQFLFCTSLKIARSWREFFCLFSVMNLSRTAEANSPKLNRLCFRP